MEIKKLLPHILATAIFLILPLIYQSPVLNGKVLRSGDVLHGIGNNQELVEYRKENGEEALWNSRLFSGMPSFQMSILHYGNISEKLNRVIGKLGVGTTPIFLMMSISMYILLLVLGVNPWLSIAVSLGFTFSTFNIISIEAGHNWKIRTLAYAPGILAGIISVFKNNFLRGITLTSFFTSLHLTSNHFQISYYLFLMIVFLVLIKGYEYIKKKEFITYAKYIAILVIAALIGVGPSVSKLWTTYEYSKETIRGGNSELSLNNKNQKAENKNTGLDKDYAMRWSYAPLETFTLIIPHFMGGASSEELGVNSNIAKAGIPNQFLKQIPTYWGEQPFTSGPVYIGAVLFFLFIFGMFILKGNIRWWLFSYSIFVIILSWGRHSSFVSGFMFEYFPLFNKFRTPSMILIMLSITFPMLSALAIQEILKEKTNKKEILKALKMSALISIGVILIFGIFGSFSYDFTGQSDGQLRKAGWPMEDLLKDREEMLRNDAFRSVIFIILAIASIWAFAIQKLKKEYLIAIIGGLILVDLWMVDKRYLNSDNFVKEREFDNIHAPNPADRQILADNDPHFRVFNVTVNPFTDARTSYFHKSLGGYHAAKLLIYQDLIENQLSRNNREVINMLNTKYFIVSDQNKQPVAQQNPEANGVGWFVKKIKWVSNANEEMLALNNFNSKTEAIVDSRFKDLIGELSTQPGTGTLSLIKYDPKHMIYEVNNMASKEQLAVFSEIYYSGNKDWKAYIDGEYADHLRVNYVLRAMMIPSGTHKVEFIFEPKSYYLGNQISLGFSSILVLLIIGTIGMELKNRKLNK